MNKFVSSILLGSIFLLSSSAFAGKETSGGGGAAVCRDSNKKITSARLLDLYEGEVRFNYNIPQINQAPKEQIISVLSKINDQMLKQLIYQTTAQVIQSSVFLPAGVGMAPTTDLGKDYAVVVPEGCAVEPIGFYETDGTLKLSQSVYAALSQTDRAAFFVHESVYKMAREMAFRSDSSDSRKIVASLFSNNTIEANLNIESLFYSATEYSLNYFNYRKIGTLYLNSPTGTVNLNINLNSSHIDLISIVCSSSKETFQQVDNQNTAVFQIDTHNCLSFTMNIVYAHGFEPKAGEEFGFYSVINSKNESLSKGLLVYPTKGPQENLAFGYYMPIFHLYKEILNTP